MRVSGIVRWDRLGLAGDETHCRKSYGSGAVPDHDRVPRIDAVHNPRMIKRDLPRMLLAVSLVLAACGQSAGRDRAIPTTAVAIAEDGRLPEFAPIEIERVQPSDFGPDYAVGELVLRLEDGTVEPLDRAAAIASEFDGKVVSAIPDFLLYQVRFGNEELEELRALRDQIARMPDVEYVGLDHVGRFDPGW
jgi:hypothetical protein